MAPRSLTIASICLMATIGGCAPAAYRPVGISGEVIKNMRQDIATYCNSLLNDSVLNPIRGKVPLRIERDAITFEMLTNQSRSVETEKTALQHWVQARKTCFEYEFHMLSAQYDPPPVWLIESRARSEAYIADLYVGRLTYGEFVRALQDVIAAGDRANEEAKYRQQLLTAAQRKAAAQEAATAQQAYQNFMQNLNNAFQPARNFGNPSLNCTSQYIGNFMYTNCN